jgi:hypothetical protein
MLPKYGGEGGAASLDSFFIGYPYEFDITLITQMGAAQVINEDLGTTIDGGARLVMEATSGGPQSPHINKIGRSVLTSCTINHASSQRVAFVGSYYPASTSLVLDFTEVRLQGRDKWGSDSDKMWHGDPTTPVDPNDVLNAADVGRLGSVLVEGSAKFIGEFGAKR